MKQETISSLKIFGFLIFLGLFMYVISCESIRIKNTDNCKALSEGGYITRLGSEEYPPICYLYTKDGHQIDASKITITASTIELMRND